MAEVSKCKVCQRDIRMRRREMCGNCYRIWQRDHFPPNATCGICGRDYFRRPSASKTGRTCSRACYNIWKKGRGWYNQPSESGLVERTCPVCGAIFFAVKRKIKKGLGRYCSPQCNGIRRRIVRNDGRIPSGSKAA